MKTYDENGIYFEYPSNSGITEDRIVENSNNRIIYIESGNNNGGVAIIWRSDSVVLEEQLDILTKSLAITQQEYDLIVPEFSNYVTKSFGSYRGLFTEYELNNAHEEPGGGVFLAFHCMGHTLCLNATYYSSEKKQIMQILSQFESSVRRRIKSI